MSHDRTPVATLLVVLLLLLVPAGAALTGPSHTASTGVTYQTNSGLAVTLSDQREVEAAPFADDQTWASDGVTLSANGTADVTVTDQTFSGSTMQLASIGATNTPITATRDTLNTTVTIDGGTTDLIVHNITLDDGATDLEVVATSESTLTVTNVPENSGVQAVDSNGDVVAATTNTGDSGVAELTIPTGSYSLRLQQGASELQIRNVLTQELITGGANETINVELQFFGDGDSVRTFNTTDGSVDLTGLPADERFSVTVDAGDGYVTRQVIIPSIVEQQNAYLLPQDANVTTVEPRFVLQDPSNRFDTENTEIIIERPIERNNDTEFVAVAGDRVGINGFDTILERDQRYRLRVRDPDSGRTRQLGAFTPTQSEQVTLEVTDIEFDSVSDVEGLDWTARYVEGENADSVEFIWRDTFTTQTLEYTIYERGNESNVLVEGATAGNVTLSETVPPDEEETVWVVSWNATRGTGEQLSATRPVSTDQLPVGPSSLPQNWQTIIAMIALVAVAGLFGAANPGVGGIATASVGGVFYIIGWLPDSTGGLMVAVAMMLAVLSYAARRARGATA